MNTPLLTVRIELAARCYLVTRLVSKTFGPNRQFRFLWETGAFLSMTKLVAVCRVQHSVTCLLVMLPGVWDWASGVTIMWPPSATLFTWKLLKSADTRAFVNKRTESRE